MRSDNDLEVASRQEVSDSVKVVVADTSPLNYLLLIDCAFLLPSLYGHIIAPPSVVAELRHMNSPPVVVSWASELPDWLEVAAPQMAPDAKLCQLDTGERDAIQLALELQGATVLIDEFKGRHEAWSRGLPIIGTLGVLRDGQDAGLIDARDALRRLSHETTFRSTAKLRQDFLATLDDRSRQV